MARYQLPTTSDYKDSVRAASTGPVDLRHPGATMDGITLESRARVLLKDQENSAENGIYIWRGANTLMTRAIDADQTTEINSGMLVIVETGDENALKQFIVTTSDPITVGVTPIEIEEYKPASEGGDLSGAALLDEDNTFTGQNTFEQNVQFGAEPNESYLQAPAGRVKLGGSSSFILVDGNGFGNNPVFKAEVNGDAVTRFEITADGTITWGDGSGGRDVDLYRHAPSTIRTGGHFIVGGQLVLGGAFDGNGVVLQNLAAPVGANDAATKQYVDDNIGGGGVSVDGNNEWTGVNNFTNSTQLSGGIAGNLSMGSNNIQNLADPVLDQDAATKAYVDNAAGGVSLEDNNTWTGLQQFNQPVALGPNAYFAQHQATDASDLVLQAVLLGEDHPRLRLRAGEISWGDGSNQTDSFMYRDSNGDLNIDSSSGSLILHPGGDTIFNQTATFNEVVDFNVLPVSEEYPTQGQHLTNKDYVDQVAAAAAQTPPVRQTRGTRTDAVTTIDAELQNVEQNLFGGSVVLDLENTDAERYLTTTITVWATPVTLTGSMTLAANKGFLRRIEMNSGGSGAEFEPNWVQNQYLQMIDVGPQKFYGEAFMGTHIVHIAPGATCQVTLSDVITVLDSNPGEDPITVNAGFLRIGATGQYSGYVQGWPGSQQAQS